MAIEVNELYSTIGVAANATVALTCRRLGCFIAATSGSILISNGDVVLPTTPVSAGGVLPLPFVCFDGQIIASGGASGVIGVA
jgi:hypothetical protein